MKHAKLARRLGHQIVGTVPRKPPLAWEDRGPVSTLAGRMHEFVTNGVWLLRTSAHPSLADAPPSPMPQPRAGVRGLIPRACAKKPLGPPEATRRHARQTVYLWNTGKRNAIALPARYYNWIRGTLGLDLATTSITRHGQKALVIRNGTRIVGVVLPMAYADLSAPTASLRPQRAQ